MRTTALVSIHDVAPRRLPRILEIVALLEGAGMPPVTLLVVPGAGWTTASLAELKALAESGHELAGHGWEHKARARRSAYHRVHAAVLSRDEAEHLSRGRADLMARVTRCAAWFDRSGLPAPELYVPPAWAMGALSNEDLRTLPFRWFETLTGFVCPEAEVGRTLPVVGFEADTLFRGTALELWNALNLTAGTWWGRPVRVAIHPDDLHLRLADSLRKLVRRDIDFVRTGEWLGELAGASAPAVPGARG